jgi:phosphoenolpyruvate carboxykinase (ATP)
VLNLDVPVTVAGVDENALVPEKAWSDKAAYAERVKDLAGQFVKNFEKYEVPAAIVSAGPQLA